MASKEIHSRFGRTKRKRQKSRKFKSSVTEGKSLCIDDTHVSLMKWAAKCDIQFCGLFPTIFPDTGRGLVAQKDILPGSVLISVPRNYLITVERLKESNIGTLWKCDSSALMLKDIIYLYLITEQRKGEDSVWTPYLRSLPKEFDTPTYFEEIWAQDIPCEVQRKILEQENDIRSSFQRLKKSICHYTETSHSRRKSRCECFQALSIMSDKRITYSEVRWAWNVVNTRCVYLSCQQDRKKQINPTDVNFALMPLLDLLNHSPNANMKAGYNEDTQCYEIVTFDHYKKGEQVFINYGPHDNRTLLLEYGFFIPDNPNRTAPVSADIVIEVFKAYENLRTFEKKVIIFDKAGIETQKFACLPEGLSWHLQTAIRIFALEIRMLDSWFILLTDERISEEHTRVSNLLTLEILTEVEKHYSSLLARLSETDTASSESTTSQRKSIVFQLLKSEIDLVQKCLLRTKSFL